MSDAAQRDGLVRRISACDGITAEVFSLFVFFFVARIVVVFFSHASEFRPDQRWLPH